MFSFFTKNLSAYEKLAYDFKFQGIDGNFGGATFDYTFTGTTDYYRYYVLRLENSGGTYDYGLDKVKLYGDYY